MKKQSKFSVEPDFGQHADMPSLTPRCVMPAYHVGMIIQVFSQTEGLVDVEFLDDSQIMQGAGSAGGIPRNGDESDAESSCSLLVSAQWSSSGGVTDAQAAGVHESRGLWISLNASCSTASDRNTMNEFLRDQPAEQDIILLARRRVPIVNTIGQGATAAFAGSTGKSEAPPSSSIHDWGSGDGDVGEKAGATPLEASSSHPFGSSGSGMTPGETVDAMITVYWDSCARDRVHITTDRLGATQAGGAAGSPENESASAASNSSRVDWSSTRLTVRVPTIAVVDPQAAVKFAERLAQQVVLGIIIGPGGTGAGQQRQMARLQLDGHDVKAIVERKAR